ncbi:MAG: hypothetical protein IK077_15450, partial [Thermoguttaceae bacterium]|nr:hypothetical protein [Thermoguttaceae bacterium]
MSDKACLVNESWLQKVDDAVFSSNGSGEKNSGSASMFYDVRPARLQTSWSQNQAGVWKASACFVTQSGTVDTSFVFDVYAPLATSQPIGVVGVERFFVVWRGRWEAIQQNFVAPRYTGGDHIQVSGAAGPDGYAIDNKGVCEAKLVTRGVADSYSDVGTLYLGGTYFKWVPSTLDIVGKKELWLKTGRKRVVTGVTQDAN